MFRSTIDLIHRVGALVDDHREYFAAVREWYADVSLANQAVRLLLARSSFGARVSVAVNGQQLAGDAATVAAGSQSLRWTLPSPPIVVTDNDIAVSVEARAGRRLYLRAASVSQDGGFPVQLVEFARRQPEPTPLFALAGSHDARFDGDVWVVQPGGSITLRVRSAVRAPVALVLTMLNETVSAEAVFDILKDVAEKVQKVRQRLEDERRATVIADPARTARLDGESADLDAYILLQRRQIEPAFRSADSGTLDEIIAKSGNPDRLVEGETTREASPAEPRRSLRSRAMPVSADRGRGRGEPGGPPRPRARRPKPERNATGVSCLGVLAGAALVFAGLGYAGWSMLQPVRAVQIDSLADGQNVAPDAPLQVWASATDAETGVESLTLAVEPAGGAIVAAAATPDRFTFPAGTTDTGSKVFTIRVGPSPGTDGKLTLTATAVNRKGQSITTRRTVAVGGKGEDLQWEIIPADPKPNENVVVVVRMVNPRPGARIGYTLAGTDLWEQKDTLEVGADGTVRFGVPGSFEGVEDAIEAWVEGTAVRRKVSYRF